VRSTRELRMAYAPARDWLAPVQKWLVGETKFAVARKCAGGSMTS
jgi:hypothetical protein